MEAIFTGNADGHTAMARYLDTMNNRDTLPRDYQFDKGRCGSDLKAWLVAQLARFTYKPGWTFEIVDPPAFTSLALFYLRMSFEAEDTYHPGRTVRVGGIYPLYDDRYDQRSDDDPEWAERRFAMTLARHILDAERHEAREWLRRDGQIYDDPHKD
jgi:hypothetical protein